jgi:hypothetical protein
MISVVQSWPRLRAVLWGWFDGGFSAHMAHTWAGEIHTIFRGRVLEGKELRRGKGESERQKNGKCERYQATAGQAGSAADREPRGAAASRGCKLWGVGRENRIEREPPPAIFPC